LFQEGKSIASYSFCNVIRVTYVSPHGSFAWKWKFSDLDLGRISLMGNARAACVLREKLIAHLISIARRELTNAAAHTCSPMQIYWSISLMPDATSSLASVNSLRLIYMKILSTRAPFAYFLDRPLHQTHSARKLKSPRSHLPSLRLRLRLSRFRGHFPFKSFNDDTWFRAVVAFNYIE